MGRQPRAPQHGRFMSGGALPGGAAFFEENFDDGLSQIIEQYRNDDNIAEGEAPEELEDCVNDGALDCPVEIIHVE